MTRHPKFIVSEDVPVTEVVNRFVYARFPASSWVWIDEAAGLFRLANGFNTYRAYRFAGVWTVVIATRGW